MSLNNQKKKPFKIPQNKWSLVQWFYNLPINSKILLTLLSVEIIPLLGLSGTLVASYVASVGVNSQEVEQIKSEITNIANNYQAKINNNASIFRRQAYNSDIQQLTTWYDSNNYVRDDLAIEVKQVLQNEADELKFDNVVLVGKDLKILVDSKKNREGKIFNPNNIVDEAIKKQKQVKANLLVKSSEINHEDYSLSSDLINKDVLIRLTVTPIKSRVSKNVIGALITEEVMNGKSKLISELSNLEHHAFSAIYLQKSPNDFDLVTSNFQSEKSKHLVDKSLLSAAVSAPGQIITKRMRAGNQNYVMAAMMPSNNLDLETKSIAATNPQTVLVLAIPERTWTDISSPKLLVLMVSLTSVLFFSLTILRKAIAKPLVGLEKTMGQFTAGDHNIRAEIAYNDEVGVLASRFNQIADKVVEQTEHQNKQIAAAKFFSEISSNIHESLDKRQILRSSVIFTREALATDRVLIFSFDENYEGHVAAESVSSKWPITLGSNIYDPCFAREYIDKYKKGRVFAITNIYEAELTQCHITLLEQFDVKANLVAPILVNGKLYGLLIAHHCSAPRVWHESDKQLLQQVSVQIGLALVNANLLSKTQAIAVQKQPIDLLSPNLTINQEKIISLDAFRDTTINNLDNLVAQFNTYTSQIDSLLAENDPEIKKVSVKSHQQFQETSYTLEKLEELTQVVIEITNKVEQIYDCTMTTNQNIIDSKNLMESTAQEFSYLREKLALTTHQIEEFNESTRQISHAISLVSKIATQINLLDINFNIEIEHYEEFKSYAKLLKEIRYIASWSKDTTQNIEEILSAIPRKINLVAQSLEQSNALVTNEFVLIEESKQKLNEIENGVQQIHSFAQSINQATDLQTHTLQTAIQSLEEIARTSELSKNSMYKVSSLSQKLTLLSEKLQTGVKNIKAR